MSYYYGVVSAMHMHTARVIQRRRISAIITSILGISWILLCGLLVSMLTLSFVRLDITAYTLPLVMSSIPPEWYLACGLLSVSTVLLLKQLTYQANRTLVISIGWVVLLSVCILGILTYYYPDKAELLVRGVWWYRANPLAQLRHQVLLLVFR